METKVKGIKKSEETDSILKRVVAVFEKQSPKQYDVSAQNGYFFGLPIYLILFIRIQMYIPNRWALFS